MSRNICGLHFNGSLCDFLVPQVGPFHLRGEIKVWNKGIFDILDFVLRTSDPTFRTPLLSIE
jgi:hypothetical protein